MFGVLQRWARQFKVGWSILFGQWWFEHRSPGDRQGRLAEWGPAKMQHAGGEEDKDPGVDDGVNGDEAKGN